MISDVLIYEINFIGCMMTFPCIAYSIFVGYTRFAWHTTQHNTRRIFRRILSSLQLYNMKCCHNILI